MNCKADSGSGLVWEGITYPRVAPGVYQAFCIGWQGPDKLRAYRNRWSIRLEFSIPAEQLSLSAFFNLGDAARPRIGARSRFYRVWAMANGEQPCKGQKLTLETFTEPGLLYLVQVADATKNEKQEDKPDALVYSKIVEVLAVQRN